MGVGNTRVGVDEISTIGVGVDFGVLLASPVIFRTGSSVATCVDVDVGVSDEQAVRHARAKPTTAR